MIRIIEDFVTEEEETDIVSHFSPLNVFLGFGRNTVKRYGSSLPYKTGVVPEIPAYLEALCQRIHQQHLTLDKPDSVTVNEYMKGQSIDWHIDSKASGPIIVVLSLLSPATMGLRYGKLTQQHELLARSLLLLSGDERERWEHCIMPVAQRRYSIVFRRGTL